MKKFLFCTDVHFGYERKGGHKRPLHDIKAVNAMLAFAKDFKPDVIILGGDILDCNPIAHHNKGKPGRTEGLKLLVDAKEAYDAIIKPLDDLKPKEKVFITGNHERFLADMVEEIPGLEGILDVKPLLQLDDWKVIPQGDHYNLGKLTFVHGDQLSGGEHIAKAAVTTYERNIRFGHVHTFQTYTKTSPIEYKNAKTGIAVPCLCHKQPSYGRGKPNRWVQGFNYGYIGAGGNFNDYVVTILDGACMVNGKLYKG